MQLSCPVCMFCRTNPSLSETYQVLDLGKGIKDSDYGHNEALSLIRHQAFNPALSLIKHIFKVICLISAIVFHYHVGNHNI